jgi:trk system potassium uptake protein TrkA
MRQFAVIGLGRFGMSIAETLSSRGAQVIAIDKSEERVADIAGAVTQAVQLDATEERALRSVGIQDVDVAVVSVGEDIEASILITLQLKELGVKHVISKALTATHGKILRKVGADRVVFPERDMGVRVAQRLVTPRILDYIELSPTHSMLELVTPSAYEGRRLNEVDLRPKYNVSVVAIKRKVPNITDQGDTEFAEEVIVAPSSEERLVKGDLLVLLGKSEDLERLRELE